MFQPHMTTLMIIVLLTVWSVSVPAKLDPNFSFQEFKDLFQISYNTMEEHEMRRKVFQENYGVIVEMWRMSESVFVDRLLDRTKEEKAAISTDTKLHHRSSRLLQTDQPPKKFDWRNYDKITPVKDQGLCGCCYSFTTTAQYETILAILTNTKYDLAQQYGLKCDHKSYGCDAGLPQETLKLYQSTGIPLQSKFPYSPNFSYPDICTRGDDWVKINATINGVAFYTNLQISQLEGYLVKYGPISVVVDGKDPNFQSANKSGQILCKKSDKIVDHATLLIGYNESHWIIKNSWGPKWGHNGYGYISKLQDHDCLILSSASFMDIDISQFDIGTIVVNVTGTDGYGDGWNGNVLGVVQDGELVGIVGGDFVQGSSYGPVYIRVKVGVEVEIVLIKQGNYSNEIGYKIQTLSNQTIHEHHPNQSLQSSPFSHILHQFCISGSCPSNPNTQYFLYLIDMGGNGWEGTVLVFRQNGTVKGNFTMGDGWATWWGRKEGEGGDGRGTGVWLRKGVEVGVYVAVLGGKSEEIGFVIRNSIGDRICQWQPGTVLANDTILAKFTPESPIPILTQTTPTTQTRQIQQPQVRTLQKQNQTLKILTLIFLLLTLVLIVGIIYMMKKLRKKPETLNQEKPQSEEVYGGADGGNASSKEMGEVRV